ncbi:MAG: alkaline phosphatase D family protein [Fimbriimonadaceae bacterium]
MLALLGVLAGVARADVSLDPATTIRRIALGSCADQDRPQPIWDAVLAAKPDVFLFLGDNVYASDPARLDVRAQYAKLARVPGFQRLRSTVPLLAVWDDHDYGVNDGGAEFERKADSQRAFCDFWNLPSDDPRRSRQGTFHALTVGPEGRRVQFLMLDTRTFRSPLRTKPADDARPGRYLPDDDPSQTILGEEQWRWLEERLREPAELRIVMSSIQVVPEDHLWEKWANFPRERDRLFQLVRQTGATGVLFVSGDRHLAEISMVPEVLGYPAYDLTASALTQSSQGWRPQEPNRWRVATMNYGNNFGTIEVDWARPDPEVRLQIRDESGDVIAQQKLRLSWLRPRS